MAGSVLPIHKPGPIVVRPLPIISLVPTDGYRLPPWLDPDQLGTDYLGRTGSTVAERTLTVIRPGDVIPLVYGRDRIGARIVRIKKYNGKFLVLCVWGEGEMDAFEKVLVAREEFTGGTHYLGTQTQVGDATILAAFGQADDLVGVAYSVLQIPSDKNLQIEAIVRGFKLYDPRDLSTTWGTNPALALAHFIDNFTDYEINWDSVKAAADYCDEVLADGPRWEINLAFIKEQVVDDIIATLKEYANCFTYKDGGEIYLVPDAPRAVDHTIDSSKMLPLPVPLSKRGMRDVPTQVVCNYTAINNDDYIDTPASTPDPAAGTPLRLTRLSMPGFRRGSMAYRKAVEVLNKAMLSDLSTDLHLFDYGLKVTAGDVLSVTSTLGLSNKQMRAFYSYPVGKGRWRVPVREYDPAAYSDEVIAEPTFADTDLPNITDIPAITNLQVSEENYPLQNDTWSTRIEATWDSVDYLWPYLFQVRIKAGTTAIDEKLIDPGSPQEARFGPLQEGVEYTVEVVVKSSTIGALGAVSSEVLTAQGKQLPPDDVAWIKAKSVAGRTEMDWPRTSGDVWAYELRYGLPASAWAGANTLTEDIRATRFATREIPPGDWRLYIKARDSVDVLSDNAAYVDISVGKDPNLEDLADELLDRASSTAMDQIGSYWQTRMGGTWNAIFTSAIDTYLNPLESYGSGEASEWISEQLDLGAVKTATWQASLAMITIAGAPTVKLQLSDDAATWTDYNQLSVNAPARYARIKVTGLGTDRYKLGVDAVRIVASVVVHPEYFEGTSLSTGPVTINLTDVFNASKLIYVRPKTTALTDWVVDSVTLGDPSSLEISIYSRSTGLRIAEDFEGHLIGA